jgi:hypothetical protein
MDFRIPLQGEVTLAEYSTPLTSPEVQAGSLDKDQG